MKIQHKTLKWILWVALILWMLSGAQLLNGIDQLGFAQRGLAFEMAREQGKQNQQLIQELQREVDSLPTFVGAMKLLTFLVCPSFVVAVMIYKRKLKVQAKD